MKEPSNWSKLQKETSAEFVDKLLLYVRTNNFEAFCFAVDRGMWYYGQEKLTYLMLNAQKDLISVSYTHLTLPTSEQV